MKTALLIVGTAAILIPLTIALSRWPSGQASVSSPARPIESPRASAKPQLLWSVTETKNPVDDVVTTVVQQDRYMEGGVIIRCAKNIDAYFTTPNNRSLDTDGGYRQNVRVRYGQKPFSRQSWIVADSFDGLFAPSPAAFLSGMIKEQKFVIEYGVDGVRQTASFDASNLGQILQEKCPAYERALGRIKVEGAAAAKRLEVQRKWENPGLVDASSGPKSDPPPGQN